MAEKTYKVGRVRALAEPNFLIQDEDGRVYLTVAVLEYDPAKGKRGKQKSGVAWAQSVFEEGKRPRGMDVRRFQPGPGAVSLQTEPPGLQTGPAPDPGPGPGPIGGGGRPPGRPGGGR